MGGQLRFLSHAYSSYTCTGSALDVVDNGLAEAMGVSSELTARTPLMLPLSPSSYNNYRAAHILRYFLRRRPSHRSLPTRAMGSALCVMGGQLWFLGHACYSYTCTGSALVVMDYGLAKAIGISSRPTIRTLLELCIITSGLKLRRLFFAEIQANCIYCTYMHLVTFIR